MQRNRKQRTSKVASLMEGAEGDSSDPSQGAGAAGKGAGAGAAQLATIKVYHTWCQSQQQIRLMVAPPLGALARAY